MWRFFNPLVVRVITAGIAIFAGNAVARLLTRWIYPNQVDEVIPGLWVYGATALVAALIAFMWVRRALVSVVAGRFFWAGLLAAFLITVTGNAISGGAFFSGFSLMYTLRIVLLLVVITVGASIGILTAISVGVDTLGKAWQEQASRVKTWDKPKKLVKNRR